MRLLVLLLLLAAPAAAQSSWEMRLAGIPIGEATLSGGATLTGTARTTGAANALRPYAWSARRSGAAYEEVERLRGAERRTRLLFGGGVAVQAVPEGEVALDAATLRGAVDPLTAMTRLLGPRPAARACALDLRFTDGVRLGRMRLAPTDDPLRCAGRWERLAGPPPADGRERRRGATFAVELEAAGAGLRAAAIVADTPLGAFVLRRR